MTPSFGFIAGDPWEAGRAGTQRRKGKWGTGTVSKALGSSLACGTAPVVASLFSVPPGKFVSPQREAFPKVVVSDVGFCHGFFVVILSSKVIAITNSKASMPRL